jgi:hypothetical protein
MHMHTLMAGANWRRGKPVPRRPPRRPTAAGADNVRGQRVVQARGRAVQVASSVCLCETTKRVAPVSSLAPEK